MATKFLDKTGLSHFWSKIKAWCNATFAAITHSHAWSTITGKPTTISGYGITDAKIASGTITIGSNSITPLTSHQDISGKVNKSGDTMTGTLKGTTIIFDGTLAKQHPSITKGTTPSSGTYYWTLNLADKNGIDYINNTLAQLEARISTDNKVYFYMRALKNAAAITTNAEMGVVYDTNNSTGWAYCPTPAADANDTRIATTKWVNDKGYITSSSNITGRSSQAYRAVANESYADIVQTVQSDNNNYRSCTIRMHNGNGYNTIILGAHNESNGAPSGIYVKNTNGTVTAGGPHPAADANDDRLATTKWVKDRGYITSSSNITGTAANVTGTVAIANGGTGATTRLNAVKALTNENVGTNATHFLGLKSDWSKVGYFSVSECKTILGLKSAAYTESSDYAAASHTHSNYLTSHQSLANYVTLNGTQTITGAKTFSTSIVFNEGGTWSNGPSSNVYRSIAYKQNDNTNDGDILFYFNSTANGASKGFILRPDLTSLLTVFWKDTSDFGVNAQCDVYSSTGHDLGRSNRKWGKVYATTGTIQTSDKRLKEDIINVPDSVLDVWEDVSWKQFKLKESIKEKGKDSARIHSGIIAQDVKELFNNANISCENYGFFCYDEWDASDEQRDNEGRLLVAKLEAGNQYSIRYEEALCIEAAYQRRKNKILEKRISELETQVQNMLQILESLKGA